MHEAGVLAAGQFQEAVADDGGHPAAAHDDQRPRGAAGRLGGRGRKPQEKSAGQG